MSADVYTQNENSMHSGDADLSRQQQKQTLLKVLSTCLQLSIPILAGLFCALGTVFLYKVILRSDEFPAEDGYESLGSGDQMKKLLEELAQNASIPQYPPKRGAGKRPVFVMGTDRYFLPLFLNHMISLRRHGRYNIHVECYDSYSCEFLGKIGFSTHHDQISVDSSIKYYEVMSCPNHFILAKVRSYIMFTRLEMYKRLLEQGHDIFMMDVDTCWLRRPEEAFEDPLYDAVFAAHHGYIRLPDFSKKFVRNDDTYIRVNPGIAYVRASDAIKYDFFPRILGDSLSHMCDPGFAQGAVSRQLERMNLVLDYNKNGDFHYGRAGNMRVKLLAYKHYRHGCTNDTKAPAGLDTAVFVHTNCHNLVKDKIEVMKNDSCWFLSSDWRNVTVRSRETIDSYLTRITAPKS